MRFNWLIVLLLPLMLAQAAVQKQTLANGLEVWTKEDKRSPLVHVEVWYNVGSKDEPRGLTGISHVLEHMMFKGTQRYPSNAYRKQMAAIGAEINAYTNQDETVYYSTAHKSNLPLILDLEADRMRNLLMLQDDFDKEMQVVFEERRRSYIDSPYGFAWDVVLRQAFVGSPYASPIIGYLEDLNALTSDKAMDWYHTYYHPNNARMVIVGDIHHKEVIAQIEALFGAYPKAVIPPRHRMNLPAYDLKRTVEFSSKLKTPNLFLVSGAPCFDNDVARTHALRLLRAVLSGATHSYLPQRLVKDKRLANDIGAIYLPWWQHESSFIINAEPADGVTLETLSTEINKALTELVENLNEEMLSDARQGIKLSQAMKEDSLEGQANMIGIAAKLGIEPKQALSYRYDLPASVEQVKAELKKLLNDQKLLTVYAYPEERG